MRDLAFLVLGVVLTLTLQLLTGRQTRQREREARLFEVRRQVYAEAMRDVNKHVDDLTTVIKNEDDPGGWGDAQAGIERLRVDLRASLGLVGTPRVRGAFDVLIDRMREASQDVGWLNPERAEFMCDFVEDDQENLRHGMALDLGLVDDPPVRQRIRDSVRRFRGWISLGRQRVSRWTRGLEPYPPAKRRPQRRRRRSTDGDTKS